MKLSLESIHADLASILVCAFFGWGPGHLNADEPRPNILFILADEMGWQDTSVPVAKERSKWNDRYRTPALERLAREGMKFTQAYSCAVYSPTRVSFLTGRNEARHGVTQWTYLSGDSPTSDLKHPTLSFALWNWNGLQPEGTQLPHAFTGPVLPELLKQAGYRTMHFGKWHMGHTSDGPRPGGNHWVSFVGQGNLFPDLPNGGKAKLNANGRRVPPTKPTVRAIH